MMRALLVLPLVAAASVASAAPVDGLVADYTDGQRRVTAVVATPNFTLAENQSIHPSVKPAFSAAWNGALKILVAGKYTFRAAPAKLILDGRPVADGQPTELAPGHHKLRLEYRRTTPKARLQVIWSSEAFEAEPIPPSAFQREGAPAAVQSWALVDRGRDLVDDYNCLGCHGPGKQPPNAHGRGPILTNVGARVAPAWLAKWLENPGHVRGDAKMPTIALSVAERADVVAYLSTLVQRGYADPGSIKDVDAAAQQAKGKEIYEKIGCVACHVGATDTGSTGPGLVSLAAVGSKMSFRPLRAYLIRPQLVDPTGRMPSLRLSDEEAAALATFLGARRRADLEGPAPKGGDAARGKALVAGRGCLGCHTIEVNGEPAPSTLRAAPFASLRPGQGCLSRSPGPAAPRFRLDDGQRAAITAFMRVPDVARSPLADFRRDAEVHRCRACHDLGQGPLMSFDHGPPSLSDTGNKLRVAWVKRVIGDWMRLRPWLPLRMPHFPEAVDMAEGFAAVAGAPLEDPPAPPRPEPMVIREGVRYLGRGEEGLSCITCHDFAWYRSGSATPAPDMSSMHARIRPDWFRRWMLDPARIQPGTQMPSFFADVAPGVRDKKIGDLWGALSLGKDMPLPEGVSPAAGALKLEVGKKPTVFRTFISDGGTRSIVVGFPGGQAFAYDSDGCYVQFAWSGEFLDVRPVWMERGGDKALPLGERYYLAPRTFPLRIGDPAKTPVPRFRGYVLERGVPVFLYDVDGAQVRERVQPAAAGQGLVRTFEVRRTGKRDVWFVPGPTAGVEVTASGATADGDKGFRSPGKGGTARFTVTVTAPKTGPAATR